MKLRRYLLPAAVVAVVLALLIGAAWQHDHPQWHSMPESLTKPPNVDRSRIPLGPYTVNLQGLIAGWSKGSVTFYVVLRPGDVHFQRSGEVGNAIAAGVAVTHISLMYTPADRVSSAQLATTGSMVGGLEQVRQPIPGRLDFVVPNTRDAYGRPVEIVCTIPTDQAALIERDGGFSNVSQGSCAVSFWPRRRLHALEPFVPTAMLANISSFVPGLYRAVSDRIQGEL